MASIALAKGKNPFGSKKKVFAVMVKTLNGAHKGGFVASKRA